QLQPSVGGDVLRCKFDLQKALAWKKKIGSTQSHLEWPPLQGGLVGVATALSPATCRPFQVFSPSFFVGLELNLPAASPVSDRCKLRLKILRRRSDGSIYPQTEEEAEAWVTYLRLVRRRESLSKLKLDEGDIVKTKDGELAEVSSIGQDGRVFFK